MHKYKDLKTGYWSKFRAANFQVANISKPIQNVNTTHKIIVNDFY